MSTPCPACGGDQATCLTCTKDDHKPVSDEVSDEAESNEWREPRSPSFDELKTRD